jgi:hypothetical protein
MKKSLFLFVFAIFLISNVSAYHYNSYNEINKYHEEKIPHNRLSDYFKYGSHWQGDIVVDLTYSYPSWGYPRYVKSPSRPIQVTHRSYKKTYAYSPTYLKEEVHIHNHNPPAPNGRRTISLVPNCGYEDGFYRYCY